MTYKIHEPLLQDYQNKITKGKISNLEELSKENETIDLTNVSPENPEFSRALRKSFLMGAGFGIGSLAALEGTVYLLYKLFEKF